MDHLLNSIGITSFAFTCSDERFSNNFILAFYNKYHIYYGNSSKELFKLIKNNKNIGIVVDEYINLFDNHKKDFIKKFSLISQTVHENNINLVLKVQGMTTKPLQLLPTVVVYGSIYIGYIENKTLHTKKDRWNSPKDYDLEKYIKIFQRKEKLERIDKL